jgi:hypothetical protein
MALRNPVVLPPPSGEGDEGKHHKIHINNRLCRLEAQQGEDASATYDFKNPIRKRKTMHHPMGYWSIDPHQSRINTPKKLGSKVALPRYKSQELVQNKKKCKILYRALLRKIDGTLSELRLNGVDMGDAVSFDISRAKKAFPLVAQKLRSPGGPIYILIGIEQMEEAVPNHVKSGSRCHLSRAHN